MKLGIGAYPPIWGAFMHPFKALRSPITQDMFKIHHPIAEIPAHAAPRTAVQLWWSKWWSYRISSARWWSGNSSAERYTRARAEQRDIILFARPCFSFFVARITLGSRLQANIHPVNRRRTITPTQGSVQPPPGSRCRQTHGQGRRGGVLWHPAASAVRSSHSRRWGAGRIPSAR